MNRRLSSGCALILFGGLLLTSLQTGAAQTPATATSAATRQKLMDSMNKGAAFLRQQQRPDGTFDNHPGITAMAAAALLRQPGVAREKQLETVGKTLDYLTGLAKPDGGIYVKDIPHYITAVSVQALVAGGRPSDKPVIEKARAYLADHLLDEGEGISTKDKFYGGMGYGGTSDGGIADIISLEYSLRAMKEAELPASDGAWQKAITFLQRTQNYKETNDQTWSKDDGGFLYYPGYSQIEGTTLSYGSATYAGILSYAWANLQKNDRRVQAAVKWIGEHYTLDENPGIGQKAVYYYYMVFAKALQALGEPVIVDAKGVGHNWREELAAKLLSLQHPEGFWVNDKNPAEMQGNRTLVTSFTMMAIQAILQ
jgi:squalene-hopene/tetraprenyl-beta-curcumene cyclase